MSEPIEIHAGPPYVEIIPLGRIWHQVTLHDSVSWVSSQHGFWFVPTARWAKNKAARVLAAHQRRDARENDRWIIE
jgi:hypothetical protein